MSEEKQAAQDPLDSFVQEVIDQDSEQVKQEAQATESAPVEKEEVVIEAEATAEEEKPVDKFQERINKVTADKYEQQRRADALQAKLDELQVKEEPIGEAPTLEQHDFDEAAHNAALVKHQVQLELQQQRELQKQEASTAKSNLVQEEFGKRVTALGKADFAEKAEAIPNLPAGVADALMQSENGAELIYHLGSHLDKADSLANMTPAQAMMELGKLSVSMNAKPEIKTSAAPDPIEPVNAGSAISSNIDDDMPIDEWMAKYN